MQLGRIVDRQHSHDEEFAAIGKFLVSLQGDPLAVFLGYPKPIQVRLQPSEQPRDTEFVHVRVFVRIQQMTVIYRPQEGCHLGVLAHDLRQDGRARHQFRFTEPPRMRLVALAWLVT